MPEKRLPSLEETLKEGLRISITDPEMLAEFKRIPLPQISEYAARALKIGVLALRSARGEVDAQAIKEQLSGALLQLQSQLTEHVGKFENHLENAKLAQREMGEQERAILDRVLESYRLQLLQTIDERIRQASGPLLIALDPHRTDGVAESVRGTVKDGLNTMADRIKNEVLSQFSRDSSGSAMSRIEETIRKSHESITRQFSLDDPTSALSRLHASVGEQMEVLNRGQMDFQTEVKQAIVALTARKEAEAASTLHGGVYEEEVGMALGSYFRSRGHVLEPTGNTTGTIRSCKVGEYVATLSADCVAAGERIVIEAKSAGGYDLAKILAESEIARKNRGAQISIFVIDPPYAPANLLPLERHGDAIVVKWAVFDPGAFLMAAVAVALALVVKNAAAHQSSEVDSAGMERAINEITRRVEQMAEVSSWATTIQASSTKILDRMRISTEAITTQAVWLMDQIKSLKGGAE